MSRSLQAVLVGAAALLLVGWTFGGALGQLTTHFLGFEYVDGYGTQWFYWFVERQARRGEALGHSDLFFYPWGKDIFAHTGTNVLDAYVALPFRMLLGPVLGYNVFVLAGLLASGVAFYALARQLTDDRLAAGVAALLFAFTPYILFENAAGRPTQALMAIPVLFVLFMWRSGVHRGWLAPVAAGVLLALSGYQYWFYAFFGGMACAAHGGWRLLYPPEGAGGRARLLGRHALIGAVALALTVPFAHSLITAQLDGDEAVPGLLDTDQWSLRRNPPLTEGDTWIALFLWQPLLRQTGAYIEDQEGVERFLFRGTWVPMLLWLSAALWLWRPGRLDRGVALAMLGVLLLLALGPLLLVGNVALPNPLYIALTKSLPFMQRLWWPARAFAFIAILLNLTVAVNLASLRRFGPRPQAIAALLVAGLWLGELALLDYAPYPTWDARVPAGYRCLAEGDEGAVIDLPYSWTQAHLYYQTAHGRPILGGMLENNPEFTPEQVFALHEENSFIESLLMASRMKPYSATWDEAHQQQIYDLGYRYVALQKDAFHIAGVDPSMKNNVRRTRLRRMTRNLRQIAGDPVYEDARMAIYAPWGDPNPCEGWAEPPDRELLGRTDRTPEELFSRPFEDQELVRLMKPLASDYLTDDDDSADEAPFYRARLEVGPGVRIDPDAPLARADDDDSAREPPGDDDSAGDGGAAGPSPDGDPSRGAPAAADGP